MNSKKVIGALMVAFPLALLAAAPSHAAERNSADSNNNGTTGHVICHNGQCWDLGDIGSECCPFSDRTIKDGVVPVDWTRR
ncbi:hypothetical protein [Streptomyces sp. NPDC002537]